MKSYWKIVLAFACLLVLCCAVCAQTPAYKNKALPIGERVSDLLARMTLEEKAEQLITPPILHIDDVTGRFDDAFAREWAPKALGPEPTLSAEDWAVLHNAAQRYQIAHNRLGVPLLFRGEGLHGFMSHHATSFPQALALASTWEPELVREVFAAVGDEMAAAGYHQAFTPVLDLARDPRWGRTEETYGEDPFLTTSIGVAAIRGLQGDDYFIDRHHVMATAKHFAAHGQPEAGANTAPGNYSERILRSEFFAPFRAAARIHVGSFMASYNEIDGVPSHANAWLLRKILRDEWGYDGYVIADYMGIQRMATIHHVAADNAQAAALALRAGVDLDDVDGSAYRTLVEQARAGRIPESLIDEAARRVLTAKFRLGLFDDPYVDPARARQIVDSAEHRALALKAAQHAVVLLKNENNLLPLDLSKLRRIAVIGPNAAELHTGGYSREVSRGDSILEGVRQRVGSRAEVLYAEGCRITEGAQGWRGWHETPPPPDAQEDEQRIREAVATARKADVVILVLGENESTNREAWDDAHPGDRDSLDLLGNQERLLKAVIETGAPTVVFLINGRPLSIRYASEKAPAIFEGWYLGEESGAAAAGALFGDFNPAGRLPITFPRSVGQLPDYYYRHPSSQMPYLFDSRRPLFPFGWGLSYTSFRYGAPSLAQTSIRVGEETTLSVEVENTGARAGDEVVQLYLRPRVSSVEQPVKLLKGFQRITLNAGEKRKVVFRLGPEQMNIVGLDMREVFEPGVYEIMVGPNSEQLQQTLLNVTEKASR